MIVGLLAIGAIPECWRAPTCPELGLPRERWCYSCLARDLAGTSE